MRWIKLYIITTWLTIGLVTSFVESDTSSVDVSFQNGRAMRLLEAIFLKHVFRIGYQLYTIKS